MIACPSYLKSENKSLMGPIFQVTVLEYSDDWSPRYQQDKVKIHSF